MTTENAIRTALATRAEAVTTEPMSGPALRAKGAVRHRRSVRVGLVVGAVAAAVVALLLAVPTVASRGSLPPASSQVDTWPARGDLADDAALAAAARRAWEAAPVLRAELPHSGVHVLLASRTPFGRYVVLTGVNALGHRRLAVLSDDPRDHAPYASRLRLRSDDAFPRGPVLLYATSQTAAGVERSLLLVVAAPDATAVRWRTEVTSWQDLPNDGGVAARVVPGSDIDIRVRAYRGHHRLGDARHFGIHDFLYRPDQALVVPRSSSGARCHGGVCEVQAGASVAVASPLQPSTLAGPGSGPARRWEDMSDQAEQLWFNRAVAPGTLSSWGGGSGVSTLLPDGTGVALDRNNANGGAERLVLYVDRPEWPIGRLYLDTPYADTIRAAGAVVPVGTRQRLVLFVADGVTLRYRSGDGAWRPLAVHEDVATTLLPDGTDPARVTVEVTYGGAATTITPATAPLPLP